MEIVPFFSLIGMTFVLEDAALLAATAWIAKGDLSWAWAFLACFSGISVGDLGLYWAGRWSRDTRWGDRLARRLALGPGKLGSRRPGPESLTWDLAIFVSRVVPGTRLPTYVSAGYALYPVGRFFILTLVSVGLWVASALTVGTGLWRGLERTSGSWVIAAIGFILFVGLLRSSIRTLSDPWRRRAWFHGWQKWRHFEFWPAWLFYAPVVPFVAGLAIRHRTWRAPFVVNPRIENGGWIGESKWQLLESLDPGDPSTLKAAVIPAGIPESEIGDRLSAAGLGFPVVFKPDVGQRGFGVRLMRDLAQAREYMIRSEGPVIAQELSAHPHEVGVFYVRRPSDSDGFIFSVTDKRFPTLVGDGVSSVGELILKDRRARMIANVYFDRLRERLDDVPVAGSEVRLVECGNHCQGALFLNGQALATEALRQRIDAIAKQLPSFHFGRFDLRYASAEDLKAGRHFHVLEINGAGSEATHIWDAETPLLEAYRTLFKQWSLLFEVGVEVERREKDLTSPRLRPFLAACLALFTRKGDLTISS